jgi:phospholipid/cholesterol/gamma-HCH transport system substrate-binding protein
MPSARRVNWAKFRVSAVAVAGLAILGTVSVLLTGGTLFKPRTDLYLYLPDGTGLGKGSPVRVGGIGVGKVGSVVLSGSSEPNRIVKVTITVERDRLSSIADDSTAQTASDTMIGDKFVDISRGTSPNRIQPGAEIQFKGSPELMKTLDMSQFEQQLRLMDAVLTDIEQGRGQVGQFVMGEKIHGDIRQKVADIQEGIHAAIDTTSAVGREIYGVSMYRKISDPLVKLDASLARLQSGQGGAGQILRDNAQYGRLRAQTAELRRSIVDLRGSGFLQSDQMYNSWNRGVGLLIRSVDEFNNGPMMTRFDAYENFRGMAKELQGTIKEFRENPRKYMRLKLF